MPENAGSAKKLEAKGRNGNGPSKSQAKRRPPPAKAERAAGRRYVPKRTLRFVTATSLFDGHDASINVMRRILQAAGAEVVHLGHNRSVDEVVTAAVQEDAHGIAVSSYQGGHVEFFKYVIDLLAERGASHIKVFGGGGGVIVPEEIRELHDYGVARVYSPEDGQKLGLQGMIDDMLRRADFDLAGSQPRSLDGLDTGDHGTLARVITALELGKPGARFRKDIEKRAKARGRCPVIGLTGTGGAGKSSLTDEIVRRFRQHRPELTVAVIAVDPSKRRTGGALLGDRIRMNAIHGSNVYVRSLATRGSGTELAGCLPDAVTACQAAGHDLVIVETSGIGQGDAEIVPFVDVAIYAMTPDYGAASQLEKIDMLDFADLVAINKFDRKGADDALRDVRKQYQRNHELFGTPPDRMPVFGTIASKFNDDGVTALYQAVVGLLAERGFADWTGDLPPVRTRTSSDRDLIVPADRTRYLAEIADTVRKYHRTTEAQVRIARERQQLRAAAAMVKGVGGGTDDLDQLAEGKEAALDEESRRLLADWPEVKKAYSGKEYTYRVRGGGRSVRR